jgi:hypothetical protein
MHPEEHRKRRQMHKSLEKGWTLSMQQGLKGVLEEEEREKRWNDY